MKTLLGITCALATLSFLIATPDPARGGVMVYDSDDVTMELGLRLQPRLVIARGVPALGDASDEWQRDFLVRRSRVKIAGKVYDAKYSLEWRLDGTGANEEGVLLGNPPISGLENGWLQFPINGSKAVQIRAGLYDQPFSRDRLTSDSKQMVVDRGSVSNIPAVLGLADNAIGADVRGSLDGGKYMYALGVFDNRRIPASLQNKSPMFVGRIDANFGASSNLYRDAHFNGETYYSLGVNGGFQSGLKDSLNGELFDDGQNAIFGVDGMVDVPAGDHRVLVRGEVNTLRTEGPGRDGLTTVTMMIGGGILINEKIQPTIRYDQVNRDDNDPLEDELGRNRGRKFNDLTIGCNYYMKGHNLKLQADVTISSGSPATEGDGDAIDGGRLQAQVDF